MSKKTKELHEEVKIVKKVELADDEFNPNDEFNNGMFTGYARLPNEVLEIPHSKVSEGAKVLYALLIRFAGTYGSAFPFKSKLREDMGGRSLKTIYRWQKELQAAGLIRVRFKGRWLPNNYYFLKSDIFAFADGEGKESVEQLRERKKMDREEKTAMRAAERSKQLEARIDAQNEEAENEALQAKRRELDSRPEYIKFYAELDAWVPDGQHGPGPRMPGVSYASPEQTYAEQASLLDPVVVARWEKSRDAIDAQNRKWEEEWAKDASVSEGLPPSRGDVLPGQESVVNPSA